MLSTPHMVGEQLSLFGYNPDHAATWAPRELWLRLDRYNLSTFAEDKRLERKSAKKIDLDRVAEYLSMWSNTVEGGILLFGLSDSGEVTGCSSLTAEQVNNLESLHTQRCPEARPDFRRIAVTVNGTADFVIAAYVPYRGVLVETNKNEAFIRRGDSKHRMTSEEKDDFRSTRHERSWEQRPAGMFEFPKDFDPGVIGEFCDNFRSRENKDHWSNEDVLIDRHLAVRDGSRIVPLNCLVLFAAKDPRMQHPACRVRVQRFESSEEGSGSNFRPVKDLYIEGNIPNILRTARRTVADLNHNVTWLNRDGKFVTDSEYPRWAWFEAIVNALVHRSYSFSGSEVTVKFFSDRLEVESPGGFVPPVNASNVYFHRASRNPHLMEALRYLGYVQMTREGTKRMRESMESVGLPAPTFSQETLHGISVRVTLRNEHENRKRSTDRDVAEFCGVDLWRKLQEHEVQIVGYAFNNGKIHVAEAQKLTGRTWSTSKKDLDRLVERGLLVFMGPKFLRDPKAHYEIAGRKDEGGN